MLFFQVLIVSVAAFAETNCPPSCDLDALQKRALVNAPELAIADSAIDENESQYDRARFAFLDLGDIEFEVAPTAARRGDIVHNAQGDISFAEEMGLWTQIRAQVGLALTPWWRIVEYWRAARQAVTMAERERDRAVIALRQRVEQSYLDAQVASASLRALRRAERIIDQALVVIEGMLDEDIGDVVESDRLRLEITRASLDARRIEAEHDRRRALARLRSLAALNRRDPIRIDELVMPADNLEPLEWHLEAARRSRPEVPLSLAGISAAQALLRARRAEFLPDLAIGAFYRLRETPVVDNQRNPYVSDPWNGVGLGYGLVYRWRLDFGVRVARLQQAQAQVAYARAMRHYALGGIAYEVERSFIQLEEALTVHRARLRSQERASQRLDAVLEEHRHGAAGSDTLTDAVRDWLSQETSLIQSAGRVARYRRRLLAATGRAGVESTNRER